MELINYSDVKSEDLPAPAEGAKIRWLIDQSTGAPNFGMMFVEVKPGGRHSCTLTPGSTSGSYSRAQGRSCARGDLNTSLGPYLSKFSVIGGAWFHNVIIPLAL